MTHFWDKFIFAFLVLPTISFAHWPAFIAPDLMFLKDHHYISEEGCTPGFARIREGLKINIRQERCVTYCPTDWTWKLEDDGSCHELAAFEFQKYEITHVRGDDGNTSYSEVESFFGRGSGTVFKFKFRSRPGKGWFCALREDDSRIITCANDI